MTGPMLPVGGNGADLTSPPKGAPNEIRALSSEEVSAAVGTEIERAKDLRGSRIAEDRRRSLRYYLGEPFGTEVADRSQVVLTDTADTIEWIVPSLMRMFTGGPHIARYVPRPRVGASQEELQAAADEAEAQTELANQLFLEECDGFMVMLTWFKDALLSKTTQVRPSYEERVEPRIETYRGITQLQVAMVLMSDRMLEPMAFAEREDGLFDLTVRQVNAQGRVRVDAVPPERFLIDPRETKLSDETLFCGEEIRPTISDLLALGVPADKVMNLPLWDDEFPDEEEYERYRDEREVGGPQWRSDAASRRVKVYLCYMRIDEDGDGYSELRRLLVAGDSSSYEILSDEYVNWQPYCSLCAVPLPHKFFGLSLADLVNDLQLIRSTILRQYLDNLYLTNNSLLEVVEGMVNTDDLMTRRPGGFVRSLAPGQVNRIETDSLGEGPLLALKWLDEVREGRTGASRWTQGLDAGTLKNQTAYAVGQLLSAAQAKVDLIGRIFAATGVKQLFKNLRRLIVETPLKKRMLKVKGQWQEVDPSTWQTDMDVEIEVGLGIGQAAERVAFLGQVLMVQEKAVQAGMTNLVGPMELYHTASALLRAMGIRDPRLHFQDPRTAPPPPPPQPDPKIVESKRRQEDNAADRQVEVARVQLDAKTREQQAALKEREISERFAIEREKIASQERIALRKAELEAELRRKEIEVQKDRPASPAGG